MIKIENTLKTSVTYNGTGTQTRFDFPFDYLRKSFVYVSVNNVLMNNTTDYTIDGRTVIFNTAPASGSVIRIYRETATDRLVVWADASVLKAADMTIQQVQQLHILEEANDWTKSSSIVLNDDGTAWQGRNYRLTNIADPVDEQDAVTKRYIDNEENSFMATMTALKNQTEQMANQASTNANNAKKSETAAKLSETNAKTSETNAKLSETAVNISKQQAQEAASQAVQNAGNAQTYMQYAENYKTNAQTYMNNAQLYMNNAKDYSENVNVFIPSVSSAGVLSWANKAGLPNPASVNIKGDKGDTGTAATIKVGTVTTGAAGSSASVTNRGDANNAILDFVLPKGADGKGSVIAVNGKEPDDKGNVNIANMVGASDSVAGKAGLVPAPAAGKQDMALCGDATYKVLPIVGGGTGADNAEVARKNLGLAIVASSGDYNDLSNKPSIPLKPKAYIVKTYRNDTEWYRVWSDGWLEQGGQVVKVINGNITFLKAFKYIPTIVTSVLKAYNVQLGGFVINQAVSTTNFSYKTSIWATDGTIRQGYSEDFTWYACGQGA